MSAAVRYCHRVITKQSFSNYRKDVKGTWSTYIKTAVDEKKFETIFQEYGQAKDQRGVEFRVHSDNKSVARGKFCMSLALKRLPGGAQSTRVLTIYENDKPHADKILIQGEFGTIDEKDVNADTFSGQFFKRVLVDMLQQADTAVVKDRDLDEID